MTDSMQEYALRSLEEEIQHFDNTADMTEGHRGKIINSLVKLTGKIDEIENIDILDPKSIGAVTSLVNTTLKALTDAESTANKRIATKVKLADQQRADDMNDAVGKIIQSIARGDSLENLGEIPLETPDQADDALTAQWLSGDDKILDTEIRADSEDLS